MWDSPLGAHWGFPHWHHKKNIYEGIIRLEEPGRILCLQTAFRAFWEIKLKWNKFILFFHSFFVYFFKTPPQGGVAQFSDKNRLAYYRWYGLGGSAFHRHPQLKIGFAYTCTLLYPVVYWKYNLQTLCIYYIQVVQEKCIYIFFNPTNLQSCQSNTSVQSLLLTSQFLMTTNQW